MDPGKLLYQCIRDEVQVTITHFTTSVPDPRALH